MFELVDTPVSAEVPVKMRLPLAKGVPAVGRTLTLVQVMLLNTPNELCLVIFTLIWVLVTLVTDASRSLVPAPPPLSGARAMVIVGAVPPVSNTNPLGTL